MRCGDCLSSLRFVRLRYASTCRWWVFRLQSHCRSTCAGIARAGSRTRESPVRPSRIRSSKKSGGFTQPVTRSVKSAARSAWDTQRRIDTSREARELRRLSRRADLNGVWEKKQQRVTGARVGESRILNCLPVTGIRPSCARPCLADSRVANRSGSCSRSAGKRWMIPRNSVDIAIVASRTHHACPGGRLRPAAFISTRLATAISSLENSPILSRSTSPPIDSTSS